MRAIRYWDASEKQQLRLDTSKAMAFRNLDRQSSLRHSSRFLFVRDTYWLRSLRAEVATPIMSELVF